MVKNNIVSLLSYIGVDIIIYLVAGLSAGVFSFQITKWELIFSVPLLLLIPVLFIMIGRFLLRAASSPIRNLLSFVLVFTIGIACAGNLAFTKPQPGDVNLLSLFFGYGVPILFTLLPFNLHWADAFGAGVFGAGVPILVLGTAAVLVPTLLMWAGLEWQARQKGRAAIDKNASTSATRYIVTNNILAIMTQFILAIVAEFVSGTTLNPWGTGFNRGEFMINITIVLTLWLLYYLFGRYILKDIGNLRGNLLSFSGAVVIGITIALSELIMTYNLIEALYFGHMDPLYQLIALLSNWGTALTLNTPIKGVVNLCLGVTIPFVLMWLGLERHRRKVLHTALDAK